jgi:hypothetical protein
MAAKLTRKQVADVNCRINLSVLNTLMGQVGGLYLVQDNERIGEIGNHAAPSWWHEQPDEPVLVEFDLGTTDQSFFVGALMQRSDWDRRPIASVKLTDGSLFVPFDYPHEGAEEAEQEMSQWREAIPGRREKAAAEEGATHEAA